MVFNKQYRSIIGYGGFICLLILILNSCECGCKRPRPRRSINPPALKMALSGPTEIRGGQNPFELRLDIQEGVLHPANYTLQTVVLKAYNDMHYMVHRTQGIYPNWYRVLDNMNGKNLKDFLNKEKIPAKSGGHQEYISIEKENTNFPKSCEFEFKILDKSNQVVAGPLQVKWTQAP
jgi:hypothetical protein